GTWRDERGVNTLDGGAPFYTTYRCADGGYVAVGALEPQFYAALLAGLALSDLPAREEPANWPVLRERFAATFATRTRAEWLSVFEGTDACVTAVASFAEARADAHLAARGVLPEVAGQVRPAPAPRFSSYQLSTRRETGLEGFELLASWGVSW
ncbi:MAG: CoA transferase, partial [Mycobacteriales bacterium]